MKLNFLYKIEKDIWCIKNYGKSSINSDNVTKTYQNLVNSYGINFSDEDTRTYIENYFLEENIDIDNKLKKYNNDWEKVSGIFIKRAEEIFGINLLEPIDVFLTINNRCPYSISQSNFFTHLEQETVNSIIMHELWHFYTWYRFGIAEESIIGKQKYNDLKESLTVILNLEFPELLSEYKDIGYPKHKELRDEIEKTWKETKDITVVWNKIKSPN